ncbi:MAG: hypothetical protein ACXWWR_03095 [Candidatus Limnocylindrales bacterium]
MTEASGGGERPTGEQPMSYAEKYRGTEWGRPEPPAPPPRASKAPLVIALVLVVAIVGAGIGLVVLTNGAGPSHPASTPPDGAIGAASPSLPARVASPSPTADPGKAVLVKLWTLVSPPDASYHMTVSGKSRLGRQTWTYREALDIVGDEYAGSFTSSLEGTRKIARKDGVYWYKKAGKTAVGVRTNDRHLRRAPFMDLQLAAWLDYVKPVSVGGKPLHLLHSNDFYRPDTARLLGLPRFPFEPNEMGLDLYVTDDGLPVSAEFTLKAHGRGTQPGTTVDLTSTASFTFSKFGAKFAIRVPKG